jgi:hypothetical protein
MLNERSQTCLVPKLEYVVQMIYFQIAWKTFLSTPHLCLQDVTYLRLRDTSSRTPPPPFTLQDVPPFPPPETSPQKTPPPPPPEIRMVE